MKWVGWGMPAVQTVAAALLVRGCTPSLSLKLLSMHGFPWLTVSQKAPHLPLAACTCAQGKDKGKPAAKEVADIVYEDGAGGKVRKPELGAMHLVAALAQHSTPVACACVCLHRLPARLPALDYLLLRKEQGTGVRQAPAVVQPLSPSLPFLRSPPA